MSNFISVAYLGKVLLLSALLYLIFTVVLRHHYNHKANRLFLLSCLLLPWAIPMLNITIAIPSTTSLWLQQQLPIVEGQPSGDGTIDVNSGIANGFYFNKEQFLPGVMAIGSLFMLLRFLLGLGQLWLLMRKCEKHMFKGIDWYSHPTISQPFSFGRRLFLPAAQNYSEDALNMIIIHERAHRQQYHLVDLALAALVLVAGWWNPFFQLIRKELVLVHEYQADEAVTQQIDRDTYTHFLLAQTFGTALPAFTHAFFQSPLKSRIMMFHQINIVSGKWRHWLLVPLLCSLVWLGSVSFVPKGNAANKKTLTVLVDVGHGGEDPGVQRDGITEKSLTLAISKSLQAQAAGTGIEIVLTRESDALPVPGNKNESLKKRVTMISETGADLLLSIHVNAAASGKEKDLRGVQAYVSNKPGKQFEQSKALASKLVQALEGGPMPVTRAIQQRTAEGIYVLDKSPKPAVLLELGYLTNDADAAILADAQQIKLIVLQLLKGLEVYSMQ